MCVQHNITQYSGISVFDVDYVVLIISVLRRNGRMSHPIKTRILNNTVNINSTTDIVLCSMYKE